MATKRNDPTGLGDRMSGESIVNTPVCHDCAHWNEDLTCKAFPDGIPDIVLYGENDHKQPIEGDHGLQYKKKSRN